MFILQKKVNSEVGGIHDMLKVKWLVQNDTLSGVKIFGRNVWGIPLNEIG